jgi:hypothetical protein
MHPAASGTKAAGRRGSGGRARPLSMCYRDGVAPAYVAHAKTSRPASVTSLPTTTTGGRLARGHLPAREIRLRRCPPRATRPGCARTRTVVPAVRSPPVRVHATCACAAAVASTPAGVCPRRHHHRTTAADACGREHPVGRGRPPTTPFCFPFFSFPYYINYTFFYFFSSNTSLCCCRLEPSIKKKKKKESQNDTYINKQSERVQNVPILRCFGQANSLLPQS